MLVHPQLPGFASRHLGWYHKQLCTNLLLKSVEASSSTNINYFRKTYPNLPWTSTSLRIWVIAYRKKELEKEKAQEVARHDANRGCIWMSGSEDRLRDHPTPSLSRFQPWETQKICNNGQGWTYIYFRYKMANVQSQRLLQGTGGEEEPRDSSAMPPYLWLMEKHSNHPQNAHFPFTTKIPVFSNTTEPERKPDKHSKCRIPVLTRADGAAGGPSPAEKAFDGHQLAPALWYFHPSPLPRIRLEQTAQGWGWLPDVIVDASRTRKLKWQPRGQRSLEMKESPFSSHHPHQKCWGEAPRTWGFRPLAKCHLQDFCGEMRFYFVIVSQKPS